MELEIFGLGEIKSRAGKMNVTYFLSFIDDGTESLDVCVSFEIHTEVNKGSWRNF